VVCLEVESAAWGLVARWGCGAAATHEVAAAAAGGGGSIHFEFHLIHCDFSRNDKISTLCTIGQ